MLPIQELSVARKNNDGQILEWLQQVVITTTQLMHPLGLRVLTPNAISVPDALARLLIAATTPSSLSYPIWITLNISGTALQYLNRSFIHPPSLETLTRAIETAIANGDLQVRVGEPAGVGEDGSINMEHWITATPLERQEKAA